MAVHPTAYRATTDIRIRLIEESKAISRRICLVSVDIVVLPGCEVTMLPTDAGKSAQSHT